MAEIGLLPFAHVALQVARKDSQSKNAGPRSHGRIFPQSRSLECALSLGKRPHIHSTGLVLNIFKTIRFGGAGPGSVIPQPPPRKKVQ
jgi:hypothetical protein